MSIEAATGVTTGISAGDRARTVLVAADKNAKPADIVQQLKLLRPIYSKTTNYGHFGKADPELTWETTSKAAALRKAVG